MSLNTEIIVALIAFLTAVSNPIFTEWAKSRFAKKKKDPVKQAIDVGSKIQDKLNKIRLDIGADKGSIIQFHNGGTYYPTGKSISKFSVFYESLEMNIPSTQLLYQQVPVIAFYKLIEAVRRTRFVSVLDILNPLLTEDYDLSSAAQMHGFKGIYAFGIFDIDDRMLGFMTFEFVRNPRQLTDLEINTILSESSAIGGVLLAYLNS